MSLYLGREIQVIEYSLVINQLHLQVESKVIDNDNC